MPTILITGGTGLIGKYLSNKLIEKGYDIHILSRSSNAVESLKVKKFTWDINKGFIEKEALKSVDYIIHLAGANIAEKRWSAKRKKQIIDSRVQSADLIYKTVKQQGLKPKAFISASAIGYYGAITSEKIFIEDDAYHKDFLGKVCNLWEEASNNFEKLNIRTVKIRTGVVLTKNKGALAKMKTPVRFGLASAIGTGNQYMPWIHIDDLCNIYIKAIEDTQMKGSYNAVNPEHITNKSFTSKLVKALNKPFWLPNIPSFIIKFIFGEMADILLEGSRVSSKKIEKTGFKFEYSSLTEALKNLLIKQ